VKQEQGPVRGVGRRQAAQVNLPLIEPDEGTLDLKGIGNLGFVHEGRGYRRPDTRRPSMQT
jgi:hypothetical protein